MTTSLYQETLTLPSAMNNSNIYLNDAMDRKGDTFFRFTKILTNPFRKYADELCEVSPYETAE